MKFGRTKIEYCCNELSCFLEAVEHKLRAHVLTEGDYPIYCLVKITSDVFDFEIQYCPFCGAKIEYNHELDVSKEEKDTEAKPLNEEEIRKIAKQYNPEIRFTDE